MLPDLPDWKGQTSGYTPRFDLLNPRWYLDNLVREPDRYRLLARSGSHALLRPGPWTMLLLLPLSLLGLARNAVARRDRAARLLLTPTILIPLLFAVLITLKLVNYAVNVIPLLFAVLITLKLVNYAVNVIPLLALTLAWGAVALWRWARSMQWGRWIRAGLVMLMAQRGFERIGQVDDPTYGLMEIYRVPGH